MVEQAAQVLLSGADMCCPWRSEDIAYKTQVVVDCYLRIPIYKPPVDQILSVTPDIKYHGVKLIPCSCDGYKVSVYGVMDISIEYVGVDAFQQVHYGHYSTPFHGLISGERDGDPIADDIPDLIKSGLHTCVEYLELVPADGRTLNQLAVLLIWIDRKGKRLICRESRLCP